MAEPQDEAPTQNLPPSVPTGEQPTLSFAQSATPNRDTAALSERSPDPSGARACLDLLDAYRQANAGISPLGTGVFPWKFGRFQVVAEAGRGGFGIVFLATDTQLNRVVALKLPRPDVLWTEQLRQRFLFEGQATAVLDHPNIVPVYEAGEIDGICYLAAGFAYGPTLATWLAARTDPIPIRLAAQLVATLADAVEHAHNRGVLHRDLKPANVMLDPDEHHPRITDFGLARLTDQAEGGLTHTGAVLGTPNYMAPEQAAGDARRIGTHTDVYALGVILYELLTGCRPIQGADRSETIRLVITCSASSVRSRRPDVPRDLEGVCLKCLEKDPAQRYPTARELAADLRRFLDGEPVLARPPGALRRVMSWCRRYPAATGLIASLMVGIAATVMLTVIALTERDRANANAAEAAGHAAEADQNAAIAAQNAEQATTNATRATENATRATENATRAEAASKRAQEQQKLAENELARALVSGVREMRVSRPLGWTWRGTDNLRQAVAASRSATDPVELRSLLATCLGRPDLRFVGTIGDGTDTVALAFSPDSQRLVVAAKRSGLVCPVHVCDVASRARIASYSINTSGDMFSGEFGRYDGVNSLAYSPDGKWLVAKTRHGNLHRWDTSDPRPRTLSWRAHPFAASLSGLAFSPDGRWLVTSGKETWRWDVTGGWAGTKLYDQTRDISFAPDGRTLAFTDEEPWICDGVRWQERNDPKPDLKGTAIAFSPDGRTLASVHDQQIDMIDIRDGRVGQRLTAPLPVDAMLYGPLRFNLDGSLLVGCARHRVYVWDVASGNLQSEIRVPDRLNPMVQFSPNGQLLAVAGENRTSLYEVRTGDVCRTIAHHADPVRAIDFTPAGELVCLFESMIGQRVLGQTVDRWNVDTGLRTASRLVINSQRVQRFSQAREQSLAVHPDGERVLVISSCLGPTVTTLRGPAPFPLLPQHNIELPIVVRPEELKLPAEGAELRDDPLAPGGKAVRLSPGKSGEGVRIPIPDVLRKGERNGWIVMAMVRVELKDTAGPAIRLATELPNERKSRVVPAYQVPDGGYHFYVVDGVQVTGEDRQIASRAITIGAPESADAVEAVWVGGVFLYPVGVMDWPTRLFPTIKSYEQITASPDGTRIWAVFDDTNCVSWDARNYRQVTRWSGATFAKVLGVEPRIRSLTVGNRVVLAPSEGGVLFILSAKTGQQERSKIGFGGIRAIAMDPTESLAVIGNQNGRLRVIRATDGEVLTELPSHTESVESIVFNQDGTLLATASLDQTVKLWRKAGTGFELIVSLPAEGGEVSAVRFNPQGTKLAVLMRGERGVRVWDLSRLNDRCKELGIGW